MGNGGLGCKAVSQYPDSDLTPKWKNDVKIWHSYVINKYFFALNRELLQDSLLLIDTRVGDI